MVREERILALKDFLLENKHDVFSRYALALEYRALHQRENALEELGRLITDDPRYIAAYQQMGQLLAEMGNKDEARSTYIKGITIAREANERHAQNEMEEELDELDKE
jgi:tetratricopeptide (TPR) repeat protein